STSCSTAASRSASTTTSTTRDRSRACPTGRSSTSRSPRHRNVRQASRRRGFLMSSGAWRSLRRGSRSHQGALCNNRGGPPARTMTINLPPQLSAALNEQAQQKGLTPEALVLKALEERFLLPVPEPMPEDEWERKLFGAALDCGMSVPD